MPGVSIYGPKGRPNHSSLKTLQAIGNDKNPTVNDNRQQ
jgi:hypothetical protein